MDIRILLVVLLFCSDFNSLKILTFRIWQVVWLIFGEDGIFHFPVGLDIEADKFTYTTSVNHTHEGSIGNLDTAEIKQQLEKIIASFPFENVKAAITKLVS